jgi:O-antigen/teichoic acid export membrane protein
MKISGTGVQTAAIMLGKLVALGVTFAMPLFLTRFLTKYEFGVYSQFYVLINFCTIFFSLGIQSNLYFFYPKATEREKKSLVVHTLLLLIIFTLVAIGLLHVPIVGSYILGDGDLNNYKGFISLGILFLLPLIIIEPLYVAKADNLTSIIYPPMEVILRLVFVVGLALLWHSLNVIMLGIVLAGLTCFLFVLIYSLKGIKLGEMKDLIDIPLAKRQLKYSWPFGLALVLNTLALQFDKLISISFLAPTAFATYSIVFYGIPGVRQMYTSLSQVYLVKMAEKYHENKPDEISAIYKSLVTKTYSFSLPAIAIVSLYAERIIRLFFTDKYMDAVPLFRVYILIFLIFMLGAGLILRATDKTIYSLKAYFFSSLFTLPFTYFMVKHNGIWGGLISAMVSIIVPKAIQLHIEMKQVNSNIFKYFPWKKFFYIAVIAGMCLVPFMLIEYFFDYADGMVVIFSAIYLHLVSLLEIRFKLFVFEIDSVDGLFKMVAEKIGISKWFNKTEVSVVTSQQKAGFEKRPDSNDQLIN